MSVKITWLGHSCFSVEAAGHRLLIDPYLDDSPTAAVKADEVEADFILLTHGHFDHVTDAPKIAQRTGATIISGFEVSEWVKRQGVDEAKVVPMNPGGSVEQDFGRVRHTAAVHSSSLPDGSYGGVAGGYVLELPDARIYFAGDTALFLDMKLIGLGGLDAAILPIGDQFTMGPEDSVEAVKFLNPRRVVPCHYNTWPQIEQDVDSWAKMVRQQTAAEPVTPQAGESFSI